VSEVETRSDIRDGLTADYIATSPRTSHIWAMQVAMLGNVCFDIMLASSRIFHLGYFYKVLRDINIRDLYHRKQT
jgi:hypothetical protein